MASERGSAKPACWLYVPDTGGDAGGAGIALRIDPGADALEAKLDGLEKAAAWLAKALADPELPPAARRGLENFSLGGMGFKSAPVDDGEDDLEEYAAERGVLTCTGEVFNPSAVQALLPDEGEEIARLHPDDAGDSPCFLDASGNVPKLVFDVPAAGNGDEYGWHRATVDLPELRQALQQPLARMRAAESARQNLVDAVRQDGMNLQDVPEGMRTPEVCLETVKQDGMALEFVPEKLKTKELCRAALQNDGMALQYVRDGLKDDALCRTAVRQDGTALEFVPEKLKTPSLCAEAAEAEWRHSESELEQDVNERISWVLESGVWESVPDDLLPETLRLFEEQTVVELDIEPVQDIGPRL